MKQRQFIRHPSGVPVDARLKDSGCIDQAAIINISESGIAFNSQSPLPVGAAITIRIPQIDLALNVTGQVVWVKKAEGGCTVGIEFTNKDAAFRARMVEQICHIESYWRHVREKNDRNITIDEAASEWITRFAGDFPRH